MKKIYSTTKKNIIEINVDVTFYTDDSKLDSNIAAAQDFRNNWIDAGAFNDYLKFAKRVEDLFIVKYYVKNYVCVHSNKSTTSIYHKGYGTNPKCFITADSAPFIIVKLTDHIASISPTQSEIEYLTSLNLPIPLSIKEIIIRIGGDSYTDYDEAYGDLDDRLFGYFITQAEHKKQESAMRKAIRHKDKQTDWR